VNLEIKSTETSKVLVANDDPTQLMFLAVILDKMNLRASQATNGYEAFKLVRNAIDNYQKVFDLVILDLNMPVMDGHDACKKISKIF